MFRQPEMLIFRNPTLNQTQHLFGYNQICFNKVRIFVYYLTTVKTLFAKQCDFTKLEHQTTK